MREVVQSAYEPYYLHQNHHHEPPLQASEYLYHHDNLRNPNLKYPLHHHHHLHDDPISIPHNNNNPSISTTTTLPIIHIPKEQRHINTLFVSGLPDDVLPREIHNIFRRHHGFDSCQLKFTGRANQVVGFVTFHDHQSAVMALKALDGVKFDPQAGSVMRIELARSNSRRIRKPGSGPYVVIDNRKKTMRDTGDTSSDDGDNDFDNQGQSEDPDSSNLHSRAKSEEKVHLSNSAAAGNERIEKASESDLRPCSTLFIANLGPNCSDDELRVALSQLVMPHISMPNSLFAGFNGMKMRAKGGMPVAFADYEEVEQATHAMEALQGSMLASSDRGGMHIEYARAKMRKP